MNHLFLAILAALAALFLVQWSPSIGLFLRSKLTSRRGSLAEGNRLNDILKTEAPGNMSREVVTVKSGENLSLGAVVGKITLGTCPSTGTAVSGNTGPGTCTAVTAGAKAKAGTYTIKCIHADAGAGLFSVEDPDGYALPSAVAGAAYTNDQINFTLNDGSPDFAVGDAFTVTIAEGSGQIVEIDFTAVDGSQNAYGFLTADSDATSAAKEAVAIVRDARVVEANLVWPDTSPAVTTTQKSAAMAQLLEKGIISVTEV